MTGGPLEVRTVPTVVVFAITITITITIMITIMIMIMSRWGAGKATRGGTAGKSRDLSKPARSQQPAATPTTTRILLFKSN